MMARPELSFDGHGINGPDEYRTRVATFRDSEAAATYGKLFAAAPDLLEALRTVLVRLDLEAEEKGEAAIFPCAAMRDDIRAAIARATE